MREFLVKIYKLPLFIIGEDITGSPIFLKDSTFPEIGELTIKYPFEVTE